MSFARTLADTISFHMNDCMAYGMMSGCDLGCPVFNRGECQNGITCIEMFIDDGFSEEIDDSIIGHYLKKEI